MAEQEHATYGKYKISGRIGTGSMGQVFEARDPILKRTVAIKTMSAKTATDQQLVQRFKREAQSAASLNHPNIITVYDFGEEQGQFYMAMELLKGKDLKDLIGTPRLASVRQKLDLMEQIAEGVGFAHSRGVIHRDLKPGNIHVQPNGRVKILDFGLARPEDSEMTQAGMVMGTPNYMSPEQVRGQKADPRSDVFSLGAVYYEVACARRAFRAETMHKILERVLAGEPDPIRDVVPDMPESLVAVVGQALAKAPADRHQDGGELLKALQAVRRELSDEVLDRGASAPGLGLADPALGGDSSTPGSEATVLDGSRHSVYGSTALKPRSRYGGGSIAPTLSGRASTQSPGDATRGPGTQIQGTVLTAPQSALPIYLGAAALVVVAVGVGILIWISSNRGRDTGSDVVPEAQRQQVGMLTDALVESQLELARLEFDSKQYQAAIEQAQQALALAPDNADAQALVARAEATLDEVTQVSARARVAFEAGDTAAASEALGKVLSLDPSHPVVAELSPKLNQYFQAQAGAAQQAMQTARTAAGRFPAGAGFQRGEGLAAEAADAIDRSEFAVATQKFVEASDAYERYRREAEAAERTREAERQAAIKTAQREAAARAEAARRAALAPPTTTLVARAEPTRTTLAPTTTTLAPVATLGRAPSAPPPPVTPPPPPTLSPQELAIRAVLDRYKQAMESRNLDLLRQAKPNLSGDEAKRLQAAFKAIKSWQVGIAVESVSVQGSSATVTVARQDVVNGRETQQARQTFTMTLAGSNWVIETIGQ